jgi:hypothetical protein
LTRFLQAKISRDIHRKGRTALRTQKGQTNNDEAIEVKSGPVHEPEIDEGNKTRNRKDCSEETAKSRSGWCDLSHHLRSQP